MLGFGSEAPLWQVLRRARGQLQGNALNCVTVVLAIILLIPIIVASIRGLPERIKCGNFLGYDKNARISLDRALQEAYPKYSLYYYNLSGNFSGVFSGLPALFIHGHTSSAMDGISMAEYGLELANNPGNVNFDFFILDFKAEVSAFYGKFLETQAEFAYKCVELILDLYSEQQSILIIGHSMGGVVAMGMATSPDFDENMISGIILLASPQMAPVVYLEQHLRKFYKNVHDRWKDTKLQEKLAVISIGGGEADTLVRTGLTSLSKVDTSGKMLWTFTTSIPGVWKTIDHIEFIWCEELIEAIYKALLDTIDYKSHQVTYNRSLMGQAFRRHLTPDYSILFNNFSINVSLPLIEIHPPWSLQDHEAQPCYITIEFKNNHIGLLVISDIVRLWQIWVFNFNPKI